MPSNRKALEQLIAKNANEALAEMQMNPEFIAKANAEAEAAASTLAAKATEAEAAIAAKAAAEADKAADLAPALVSASPRLVVGEPVEPTPEPPAEAAAVDAEAPAPAEPAPAEPAPAEPAPAEPAPAEPAPAVPAVKSESSSEAEASPPKVIKVGCKGLLKGLNKRSDLNGREIVVVKWVEKVGRWGVRLTGSGETVKVNPSNIDLL